MKPISTKTHGIIDYTTGATMSALPFMMECSPATRALLESNAAAAGVYSMLTDYELGLLKLLPMQAHLVIDAIAGAGLLGAAAVMTSERPQVRAVLAGLGLFGIATAFLTESEPQQSRSRGRSGNGSGSNSRRRSTRRSAATTR
jgi:hypothetical protein